MHRKHRNSRMLLTVLGLSGRGPALRDAPSDSGGADGGGGDGNTGADGGDDKGGSDSGDGDGKAPKFDGDLDKDRAARALAASRDSERKAKERATAAEKSRQDLIDGIAVALGLKPDPKTDPATIAAQAAKELTDSRAEVQTLKVENALLRLAGKAGGDVEALRDSRTFMTALAALDPSDKDFDAQVTAAVKDAIKANPKLGTASQGGQGPNRQGADMSGGNGGRQRPAGLGAAIAARLSGN